MQKLAEICVRRPVFATMLILALTVVGVFSFFTLGVDLFPRIDFPTITITVVNPGASPQEIETEITDRVEAAVNTISGIDELRSTSVEGVSQVFVTFVLEKNADVAAQEARDKISLILDELPETAEAPIVLKLDTDAAPILRIVVSAPRPLGEVNELAENRIAERLESVSGVGRVEIVGGSRREIRIQVDPNRLRAFNVTVNQIVNAVRAQNLEVPGGRLNQGAREATVTIIGYLGVALAFVIALAVAGFEFTNLAIIAGALSVGIGFGLQAIVNNFVSGLILLFERPIKTGDWIVVGNTEGYVKRISIRSTMIQTFDRADVIVPNSDLISGQVTNWTLGNTWGRLKIQIGVAYGSDIETVIETLLEVANNNAEVIKGNPKLPDPYALFLDFGDSSLDFELCAIIRDINRRRYVTSDINRAINAAFNKQGIEIPFPQRDLHVRSLFGHQDAEGIDLVDSRLLGRAGGGAV